LPSQLNTADDWIIYLAFLLQNGSGDCILDGDEGRVGHGPRGEGGAWPTPPPDPPLVVDLQSICYIDTVLKTWRLDTTFISHRCCL